MKDKLVNLEMLIHIIDGLTFDNEDSPTAYEVGDLSYYVHAALSEIYEILVEMNNAE